ncbi:MAG TPA: hypothetical protein VNK96_10320 [Fimbriimonadales bacterium]|nr:hypothetical protein [Fimbriimonadales bacterium]
MKRLIIVLGIFLPLSANAVLLWDFGPTTGNYGGCWSNYTNGQNFADMVIFSDPVVVTQLNYFSCYSSPGGSSWKLKLLDDNGGIPGNYLVYADVSYSSYSFAGNFGGADIYVATFPVNLALNANTPYWIGVSGNGFEGAQASVVAPGDGKMAQFSGTSYSFMTGVGDQMFQLEGYIVPEPISVVTLAAGLLLLIRRRR